MQDIFQVGNAHFAFAPETSAQFVDGGMQFELHTLPVAFDKALHAPAFQPDDVDNPSEGTIAPRFGTYGPFFFYDKTDEAHRVVQEPQTRPATFDFRLYERGFAWDRFQGEVTLTPSLVEIRGVMKAYSGDGADSVAIHVRKAFEPGEVMLKPHTYTSLAEAAEVPPERVQRLLIAQPWERGTPKFDAFPPEILRFSRLEFLSLQFAYPEYAPFTALPDAFCALGELKELFIRNSSIAQLPEDFGALAQLEVLSMEHGKLERLPDSICKLARLQRLLLNGNALERLPECIGDLPALRLLAVEKNPFVSLPASLKKIEKVNLERKLQALYQDIAYRKDIDVPVAPAQFLAQGDDRYTELLAVACGKHKLKRYLPALLRVARRTVRYRTTEPEDYAHKGNTRFGGAPDLPPGMAFPLSEGGSHWRFYAQLNLAEVAPLQPYLPREGMLYFFGEDQESLEKSLVVHSTAPLESLVTYAYPEDVQFENGFADDLYPGLKAFAEATVSVPNLYRAQDRWTGRDAVLMKIEENEKLQKAYWALDEELSGKEESCHLVNAHVFTQHKTPEEQASDAKGGLPGEWINLLTLESDRRPNGFCFWDAGTLTYSIHMKDLALGDFSRVFVSLESS